MQFNDTPAIARWTTRLAVYAAALAFVALLGHRFASMSTLTAFNLVLVSFIGAFVALILGVASAAIIWRHGCAGAYRTTLGIVLSLALLGWPLAFLPLYRDLPAINDVSTDTASPPKFVELVKLRGAGANSSTYPLVFAKAQAEAYPDLKPMLIDRPVEETFEIAREAVFRQKMTIVREQAPDGKTGNSGLIEAVDRTLVFGLHDDIALRIDGDGIRSRIDLRSASRFGRHDLGRNAERMRRLMREIVARLEATIPSATGESYVKWRNRDPRKVVKQALDAAKSKKLNQSKDDKSRKEGAAATRRSRAQE